MKKIIFLFLALSNFIPIFPQSSAIQWQKTFGGTNNDGLISVINISDKGFLPMGTTYSTNYDFPINKDDLDF